MKRKPIPHSHAQGISVIEVLIALSMAAIIFVSIGTVLASVHRINTASSLREQAQNLAKEPIEILTDLQHSVFGCICPNETNGSLDDCDAIPGTCIRSSDAQQCTLPSIYTSCWTAFPENLEFATPPYHFSQIGTTWQLNAGAETIVEGVTFSRTIDISNIRRDNNGAIIESGGTEDPGSKKITSTVSWSTNNKNFEVSYTTILTAWQNQ